MKVAVTTLAVCIAALLALGLVMLYSASMTRDGGHYLMMQIRWCALGFIFCVAATALDYQWLKKATWPIYGLAIFLLLLVIILGQHRIAGLSAPQINGARRWLDFHGLHFQASELAKLALIITLAWYGDFSLRQMQTFKRGVVYPGALAALILGLVFVEPDRGTTILLAAVAGSMLLTAGVRWTHLLIPAAVGAAGLAISILHDPMRMNRILAWRHPQEHLNGAALQAHQAMMGLGSGGWFGVGLGNGMQKYGYLPEIHTDFIFAIIGEELGLIATLLVIVAFVVIAICGIYIALNSRDTFGFQLALGITLLIAMQAAINIGVVTSALPNKGLPLPFISYGGSNLFIMLTGVGLLFSVARHAPAREKASKPVVEADDNPFAARAT